MKSTDKQYMAIDQWGQTFHGLQHPRKDLMEQLSMKSANKMYVDGVDGKVYHIGYVVGGHWCRVFEVKPMRKLQENLISG